MFANSAFVRHVIILKGIDTKKDEIPFGYIKIQAIVDMVDLEVVLQGIDCEDERLKLMGVVKKIDGFFPIYFARLEKPQKMMLTQNFSTGRLNMFSSGYQLKEIVGFAIVKEKKGKNKLLLIGGFDDGDIYKMERDIINELENDKEGPRRNEKEEIIVNSSWQNIDTTNDDKIEAALLLDDTKREDANLNQVSNEMASNITEQGENLNNEDANDAQVSKESEIKLSLIDEKDSEQSSLQNETKEELDVFKEDKSMILNPVMDEKNRETIEKDENDNKEFLEKGYDVLEYGDKKIWKKLFEELKEHGEKFKPFSDDKIKWIKINKKDIYKLSNYHPFLYVLSNPFVFKFVSNQGFLIIGYRHSKKRDRIEILLPGEFSEDNIKKARVFGFIDFITKDGKIYEGKEGYFKMSIELIEREE